MYILNERKYIEHILETNIVPDDLSKSYLIALIAKYNYVYGITVEELSEIVKERMRQFEFDVIYYQEYKWSNKITKICKSVVNENHEFKERESIPVYEKELEIINGLDSDRKKKLMFTMIILARYMDTDGWINKKDSKGLTELFKLANITLKNSDKYMLIHELYKDGYVRFTKMVDNLNIQIDLHPEGKIVYECTEFSHIGNQYIGNFKKGYGQCKECGKKIKVKSKYSPVKYCEDCAKKIKNEQNKVYYYENR